MKKYYFAILSSLIIIAVVLTAIFTYNKNQPKFNIFIDHSTILPVSDLNLIYSDITMQDIECYRLKDNQITKEKSPFLSYTKGVIPADKYHMYHALITTFNATQHPKKLTPLHNYYEDDNLVMMSYLGTLSDTYFIDKKTNKVHSVVVSPGTELSDIYVSYIRVVNNNLILLSMKANAYEAVIYRISLDDFSLNSLKTIPLSPDAITTYGHGINSEGICIFTMDKELMIYNSFTDQTDCIPLPFSCSYIACNDQGGVFAGNLTENSFKYVLLDKHFRVTKNSDLSLPAPDSHIVSLIYQDAHLYTATYHSNYALYPNYISVYTLKDSKLIYCIALLEKPSRALFYLYL